MPRALLTLAALLGLACHGGADLTDSADPSTSDPTSGAAAGSTDASSTTTTASSSTSSSTATATTAEPTSTTSTATTTTTDTGDVPPGGTVPVGGGDYFLLGANYPWHSYGGDFGGNNWGTYGVHTVTGEIGGQLDTLAGYGARVVRWFVFTDGRAGITFAGDGTPTGLGDHVLEDMQAALDLAHQRGLYLVPVLFDFHWMFWSKQENGVQIAGRSDTLTDPARRAALLSNVVAPLLQAFPDDPAILAWEVMNEPEWSIADLPAASPDGGANPVPLADFYAFAAGVVDLVHAHTGAYATLGSASLKWYRVWTPEFAQAHGLPPLDLDFYQTHYYPWMDNQQWTGDPELGTVQFSPTVQKYADLGLSRPMVVGEFIMSDQAGSRLDNLLANGYAGAWPWSLTSDYSLDGAGMASWASAHPDLVDLPAP